MRFMVILVLGLLLVGCGTTQPSRFFLLTATPESGSAAAGSDLLVGVGPVILPGVLERPQIVTRIGANELHVDEFARWGESLRDNFIAVFIENLATALGTDQVFSFESVSSVGADFRVTVDVHRFDSGRDTGCVLDATWQVFQGDEHRITDRSRIDRPLSSEEPEATVAAMSAATADLSRAIAEALAGLPAK